MVTHGDPSSSVAHEPSDFQRALEDEEIVSFRRR